MERSLRSCTEWHSRNLPTASMLPTVTTNVTAAQPNWQLQHNTTHFYLRSAPRPSRLQRKTIRPAWHGGINTRQAPPTKHIRTTLQQGLCIGYVTRALQVLSGMVQRHESYKSYMPGVSFKHKYLTNPHVTPEDQVMAAAANLATVLTANKKANQISHKKFKDLQCLHSAQDYSRSKGEPERTT